MANYYTHLAFAIPATAEDAARFSQAIEQAALIGSYSGTDNDDELDGIACRFDSDRGTLAIFDSDGSPTLGALATTLQDLFPDKLPLGFVYSCSCDKARPGGFGGGLIAIGADSIVERGLSELLAGELTDLRMTSHAA